MENVHYDVEKIISNMRAEFTKVGGSGDRDAAAQHRHREITICMARLFLEERNRGENADFILFLIASYVAEFIENMSDFAEASTPLLANVFLTHLMNCLGQGADGTAEIHATVVFEEQSGGRA